MEKNCECKCHKTVIVEADGKKVEHDGCDYCCKGKLRNMMDEKKIQLPKDSEARRCVLIVIEEHIGVPKKIVSEKGYEYVIVLPYKIRKEFLD